MLEIKNIHERARIWKVPLTILFEIGVVGGKLTHNDMGPGEPCIESPSTQICLLVPDKYL